MRKLIFIFLFALSALAASSQPRVVKYYFPWLEAQDITNNRHFIWHGDTIDFANMQATDSILISMTVDTLYIGPDTLYDSNFLLKKDSLIIYVTPKQLSDSLAAAAATHDPVTLSVTATAAGLSLSAQELRSQSATGSRNGYLTSIDWTIFYNKLTTVAHDTTMNGMGTISSPLSIDTTIIATKWYARSGDVDSSIYATRYWSYQTFLDSTGIDWPGTFDGHEGTYYLNYNNITNKPTIPVIDNTPFNATWDGNLDGATKNVIYDAIVGVAGGVAHNPVSLDPTRQGGLSLIDSTQVLSLDTANISTTGALSKHDYSMMVVRTLSNTKAGNNVTVNINGGTGTTFSVADADSSKTNETNTSASWDAGTKVFSVTDPNGTVGATITGFLTAEVDGSTSNEFQDLGSTKSGTTVSVTISDGSGASFSVADNDSVIGNEYQNLSYTPSTGQLSISNGTGVLLPLFSTTTANAGFVPGSSGVGETYFLNATGNWTKPSGTTFIGGFGISVFDSIINLNLLSLPTSIPYASNHYIPWVRSDGSQFKTDVLSFVGQSIFNANKIHGKSILPTTPSTGQVLRYNGSFWEPSTLLSDGIWTQGPMWVYVTDFAKSVVIGSGGSTTFSKFTSYSTIDSQWAGFFHNTNANGNGIKVSAGSTYSSSLSITDRSGINLFDVLGSGRIKLSQYGSGTYSGGTAAKWLGVDSTGYLMELPSPVGSGTVTSVGLSLPSIFSVSGSPVTSSGTLTASLASQSANLVFASPLSTSGTPGFRALADNDIPNNITASNYLPLAGGTMTGKIITLAPAISAGLNLPHGTSPTSPANGDIWTTTAGVYSHINGATQQFMLDPMTTRGDLIYRNTSNVTSRLPVGASGQILSTDGTDVYWDNAPSGADNWGNQYVVNNSDSLLKGRGTTASPLKIDTAKIATQYDLTQLPSGADNWGTQYVTLSSDSLLKGRGTVDSPLKVDSTLVATKYFTGITYQQKWVAAPATKTSTGTAGQMAYDHNFLYICTATNTWKRTPLASW